ncbi:M14 family metallopeptidase [Alteromonas sp. ASW11-130]|uniref:M14 family metallopeptidase n=1 Tax=Alteromonas sp. ASW11-130 TaxID=3015775 RepID=UPI0022419792|nr:M14 family metallopeptidase [Alteromonas sp. ASW11-130]MCW8093320.1 M14 family metallopeptidase [Alteromonas sp. ASW11-130]
MNKLRILISLVGLALLTCATQSLAQFPHMDEGGRAAKDYLPKNVTFNPAIPTPEAYLGNKVGEWHVRHDQLVGYMQTLAKASDRLSIEVTGYTHENRPLVLVTATSKDNQSKIDSLRNQHIAALDSKQNVGKEAPLFLYMGYSIHGNEPSGSNAAMVVAYYLAAAQGNDIEKLLSNAVVLLDPSLNPDGLSRFAHWANMHKGKQLNADREHREHQEGWPSGRTNHYWFDLNRDWLLLTHPESQARIRQFHKWRPHVLTDFHEMDTDSTYFFQPGVASRKNPWTPDANVTLTEALAKFHAKAFDDKKVLYFSQEAFDDFYYGKGSTYPDAHGSIGILFEQASSRGHLQTSINGEVKFADTIQNQVTTSLSTFAGALANKAALLNYQSNFAKNTQKLIDEDHAFGHVMRIPQDKQRAQAMINLLDQHQIQYHGVTKALEVDKRRYEPGATLFIPLNQPQYRLVKSLFSTRTSFTDNTFYDVSSWNLPYAFNVEFDVVSHRNRRRVKASESFTLARSDVETIDAKSYAYAFEWHHYYAPALLQALLEKDVKVRSAGDTFTATLTNNENYKFSRGTILIPMALQDKDVFSIVKELSQQSGVPVHSIATGLTSHGIDLGSSRMVPIEPVKLLLVGGKESTEYDVGEVWHYLDTKVGLPVSIVELSRLKEVPLQDYTHVVFVSGDYGPLDELFAAKLSGWIQEGGVLIGQQSALKYFESNGWLNVEIEEDAAIDEAFSTEGLRYADKEALEAKKLIAGATYEMVIDSSHPVFYGYERLTIPVFKSSNLIVKSDNSPFTTIARYNQEPLLAGYTAPELVKMVAATTAVISQPLGEGAVIAFTDNIHFRGYWYGTNKLMSNAIYQSAHIN